MHELSQIPSGLGAIAYGDVCYTVDIDRPTRLHIVTRAEIDVTSEVYKLTFLSSTKLGGHLMAS